MNVLYIGEQGGKRFLLPSGDFNAYPNAWLNRTREIEVVNESDPYGDPLYVGPALNAGEVLEPGVYWFEYAD